ncbi:PglZ domain-containing protein [Bacillus sp. ISL-40]|uniref:PglZ domain-containing protein n=1 Tax=Bacillus sp. ISL-40 TaxID=2819126 RepID=UPI001BE8B886|nr:PglZ domain-containing protein [Bacillus sp. ISL-40]MBT2696527.1 PglZ domain-containing protein [Bacillus sp. ISL-40]
MKKTFYDMVAADLNRHFQKRSVVIWLDKYQSFTSEYERFIKEENMNRFVFEGSFLQLRHQIVQFSPDFERRILIYIPDRNYDLMLLKEYKWLAEVFNDSIRDLLSKHYNINLPLNENDRLQKQLLFIKTKWDILSDDLIENLNEEKLEQFILHNHLSMDELDKKETILRFITDKTYYQTLKELENLHAFCQLANDYYGFLFNEQRSYEEMVEVIANTLIQTELSLDIQDAQYTDNNPKIAHRRSELFHLWSKHDFYRSHFEEWSKQLSNQYKQQIALKETEELYSIKGFSIIDEELWNRIEKQILPNTININLLTSPAINQFILIAEARLTRATDKEIIRKWNTLSQLLHFIVELNKFKDYINQTSMFQDPESIVKEYIQQKWWAIDYHFRKAEEQYKENNSLIISLIKYANGQYIHHFLKPLNAQFQRCLEPKQDFSIDGITQQRHFWRDHLNNENKKTAVIYVDALRYEMGTELQHLIDEEWHVEVESLLSSLPSITKIGMTALLPLSKSILEWKKAKEDYVIYTENDIQMNTKTDRIKFLENVLGNSGKVVNLESFYRLSKEQIIAEISDKETIIIYSNEIDTTGENIEDSAVYLFPQILEKIKIVTENILRAGVEKVVITADHGFLLTNGLEEWNQIPLSNEVEVVKKSRRYAIGENRVKGDWIVKEIAWSHHKGDYYQYYPSSNYFFTANGGAKFSHGGLSIQEVIIPVLTISPMDNTKVYIDDPRIEQQSSFEEITRVDDTVNTQDLIKIYLKEQDDDLSKREKFLLSCFLDSTKWNENELIQRAATKKIKFKSVLVSEAMSELILTLKAKGKDWFKTDMINGTIYEYSIK